tara:strand:- start:373 stop:624 length:252 start_codon:yes stop_codon:yes gene_type:complete
MDKWQARKRPPRLEKRFEFNSYEETRDFLDRLGDHSEAIDRFPDISFGKQYANITVRPDTEKEDAEITEEDYHFARDIDGLFN